jgi:hypothetical protein
VTRTPKWLVLTHITHGLTSTPNVCACDVDFGSPEALALHMRAYETTGDLLTNLWAEVYRGTNRDDADRIREREQRRGREAVISLLDSFPPGEN